VESCLRDELIETVKAEAGIKGVSLPLAPVQVAQTPFQIDSLVVVSILCAVEPIVGFELPEVIPRIEKVWINRKGGKP